MAEDAFPPPTAAIGRERAGAGTSLPQPPAVWDQLQLQKSQTESFSPFFFSCNSIFSLGIDKGISLPQSPARLRRTCTLCWRVKAASWLWWQCPGGQWCAKCRMGCIYWQHFRSSPKTNIRVWFQHRLFSLVFWCWWRLMQFPEICSELLF